MQIPVAIFKEEESVFGVSVPGIPGCHSWGDTIEDALKNTREAIYSHIETLLELGEPAEITQMKIEDLSQSADYVGAIWALVDLEWTKLDSKPERINVSLPRFVLAKIDRFAEAHRETRSGLLARAALELIANETAARTAE
jgi:predicted RNase H-like HicB family nuclease